MYDQTSIFDLFAARRRDQVNDAKVRAWADDERQVNAGDVHHVTGCDGCETWGVCAFHAPPRPMFTTDATGRTPIRSSRSPRPMLGANRSNAYGGRMPKKINPKRRRMSFEVPIAIYDQLEAERQASATAANPCPTMASVVFAKLAKPLHPESRARRSAAGGAT